MNQKIARPLKGLVRYALHTLGKLWPGTPTRVLMYHSIDDFDSPISVSPELLRQQMDYLVAKRYVTWTAGRFVDALRKGERLPRRLTVLTFDDGYLNNVTQALPILEERGLCATMFMVTNNAGEIPHWGDRDLERIRRQIDEDFPGGPEDKKRAEEAVMKTLTERLATWEELKGTPERGLEILSHTRTHCFMDDVDGDRLQSELAGSRRDLEEHGLGSSNSLAWPYGKYDQAAIEAAEAAGYRGAYLGEYYWELRDFPDPWRIHRVGVDGSRGLFGFAFALGRGPDLLAWLKRLRNRRELR